MRRLPFGYPRHASLFRRFELPNKVWRLNLGPEEFMILSYIYFRSVHGVDGEIISVRMAAAGTGMKERAVRSHLAELVRRQLVTEDLRLTDYTRQKSKQYFFTLPNEIFSLGLSPTAFAVYGFLLYCEDRDSHQCHLSYRTIGEAIGKSKNTVKKYVDELVDKQLIITEYTTINRRSDNRRRNGSLCYTILPIDIILNEIERAKMKKIEEARELQRIRMLVAKINSEFFSWEERKAV